MGERKYYIYIILLLVVVILNLPIPAALRFKSVAKEGTAPFQNIMSLLLTRLQETRRSIADADKVLDERKTQLEEIALLKMRLKELEASSAENQKLRQYLDFKQKSKYRLISCEVVSRGDVSGWWQTVTVNKGSADGIKPDMAVMTCEGIVGRTKKGVSIHNADVLLMIDPLSKISCKLPRTGATGIIKGSGISAFGNNNMDMVVPVEPLKVDFLDKNAEIRENDEVVTSGLGGVFPEGLVIGYVGKTSEDASGLFKTAEIIPAAEMRNLKYLFVVDRIESSTERKAAK